jgi:hypothetical protein
MCKHHIPKLTTKTFEKVLGNLLKEKKIFCVYCPEASKYVFANIEYFKHTSTARALFYNKNGFLKNNYRVDDSTGVKLDNILEEDIERLVS